jgi:hypothetical protein
MGGERELKEGPKKKEALGFEGVRKCLGKACFTELGSGCMEIQNIIPLFFPEDPRISSPRAAKDSLGSARHALS